MHIMYANGGDSIQELNDRYALLSRNETSVLKIGRYRKVPTFGRGTIRHFASNASGMKKLAARDYEDLLQVRMFHLAMLISLKCCDQCAIPVFEALLPTPHNRIIMDLLFELATWHALAKLRLRTETTLRALDTSTKRLGNALRTFKKVTCVAYITKELPSEEAARGRRQAALRAKQTPSVPSTNPNSTPAGSKREKHFIQTPRTWWLCYSNKDVRNYRWVCYTSSEFIRYNTRHRHIGSSMMY